MGEEKSRIGRTSGIGMHWAMGISGAGPVRCQLRRRWLLHGLGRLGIKLGVALKGQMMERNPLAALHPPPTCPFFNECSSLLRKCGLASTTAAGFIRRQSRSRISKLVFLAMFPWSHLDRLAIHLVAELMAQSAFPEKILADRPFFDGFIRSSPMRCWTCKLNKVD